MNGLQVVVGGHGCHCTRAEVLESSLMHSTRLPSQRYQAVAAGYQQYVVGKHEVPPCNAQGRQWDLADELRLPAKLGCQWPGLEYINRLTRRPPDLASGDQSAAETARRRGRFFCPAKTARRKLRHDSPRIGIDPVERIAADGERVVCYA